MGRCEESYTTDASETKVLDVRSGIFLFENSAGGEEILAVSVGDDCYAVDDQTVGKTSASSTLSIAGKVHKVTSDGVFVAVNPLA